MRNLFLALGVSLIGLSVVATPLAHAYTPEDGNTASEGLICPRPVKAVLSALQCFENEDAACVANAYSADFVLMHNDQPTATDPSNSLFWNLAFMFSDFSVDINHLKRVGLKQVSIRYVETLDFTNNVTVNQHEHALVTVDRDCRIQLWDQYGDDAEQQAVSDNIRVIILCQQFGICQPAL